MRVSLVLLVIGSSALLTLTAGAGCSASGTGVTDLGSSGTSGQATGGQGLPGSSGNATSGSVGTSGSGGTSGTGTGTSGGDGTSGAIVSDAGADTGAKDASVADAYVPPGGPGVTITVGGATFHDGMTTMRRNTAVGGGGGGSDGSSYTGATTSATPADSLMDMSINSASNYLTVGNYPCDSASSPAVGYSQILLSLGGSTFYTSPAGSCIMHVLSITTSGTPHVTGSITGTLKSSGGALAPVVGTFDLDYSN